VLGGIDFAHVSTIFLLNFGTVLTMRYFFVFIKAKMMFLIRRYNSYQANHQVYLTPEAIFGLVSATKYNIIVYRFEIYNNGS
jgi:hypothetical protein